VPTGRVKHFDKAKNFGFIAQDGGRDVFVHSFALRQSGINTLREGDAVAFDIVLVNGKMRASAVRLIEAEGAR
jgi:cold shock CspA family protein